MEIKNKMILRAVIRALIIALLMGAVFFFEKSKTKNKTVPETARESVLFSTKTGASAMIRLSRPGQKDFDFQDVLNALRKEIRTVETLSNASDPESELAKLNASAADTPFVCSEKLWTILTGIREIHRRTNGASDAVVIRRRNPGSESAPGSAEQKNILTLKKIRFDDQAKSVFFTDREIALNLDEVWKGCALDSAHALLKEKYPEIKGVLTLDGIILSSGTDFQAFVRNPRNPREICAKAILKDGESIAVREEKKQNVIKHAPTYAQLIEHSQKTEFSSRLLSAAFASSALESEVVSILFFMRGNGLEKTLPEASFLLIEEQQEKPGYFFISRNGECWTDVSAPMPALAGKTEK